MLAEKTQVQPDQGIILANIISAIINGHIVSVKSPEILFSLNFRESAVLEDGPNFLIHNWKKKLSDNLKLCIRNTRTLGLRKTTEVKAHKKKTQRTKRNFIFKDKKGSSS